MKGLLRLVLGGTASQLAGSTIIAAPGSAIIAEPVLIVSTILTYKCTLPFILLVIYFLIQVLYLSYSEYSSYPLYKYWYLVALSDSQIVKSSLATSTLIITVPLLKVSTYGTFLIHILYLLYCKCLTYLLGGTAR